MGNFSAGAVIDFSQRHKPPVEDVVDFLCFCFGDNRDQL